MYVVILVEFEITRTTNRQKQSAASQCTYTQTAAGYRVSSADGAQVRNIKSGNTFLYL